MLPDIKVLDYSLLHDKKWKMRKVGLIGGTSWHSTIEYYKEINQRVNHIKGNRVNPPLLVYNVNQRLINDLQIKDNWDEILKIYLNASNDLINAGVEAVALCSNSAHMIYNRLVEKIKVPVIHIADAIGQKAFSMKINRLGLLGTVYTMESKFIKRHLQTKYNIEVIVPKSSSYRRIMSIIYDELSVGVLKSESQKYVIEEMRILENNGAEGIILGCTELPMLVKENDFEQPIFNTISLHCELITKFILKE